MKYRDQLYQEAIAMIEDATPHKESILYHNIYSLQTTGGYPFSSKKDVHELVNFLNSCD
ncbi:hypothetical protein [Draconibacterium orientale]|uniref:hypothetical protein n=1 Tax=Draconibacterium orientale TaxID=1168034 RepID=UPI0029C02C68|nr:hypothetical protein [Draconibacterium orientale]